MHTEGHIGSQIVARAQLRCHMILVLEAAHIKRYVLTRRRDVGNACEKQTVGLLQRRHVYIDLIKFIGKESNSLEDVDAGLIHSDRCVYTEYPDPRRDEWQMKILPALRTVPLAVLITETGMSRRALLDLRAGRSRPHARNLEVLVGVLRKLGLI
jgi:hypothetical protein